MQPLKKRIFSTFLILMLFAVFNLCAVESIAASISSELSFINQSNYHGEHAGKHSHESDASHDHDGNNQDENCCSNVLASQTLSGVSSVKNLILKPAASWVLSLPVVFQRFSDKFSHWSESSFDSDSSPPTVYRATYPSHAPPLHI